MYHSMLRSLALVCLTMIAGVACAAGPAVTDPKKAGPEYEAQGEYAAEFERDGETRKAGVQVIALGKGEFEAVVYQGGLPGDGWQRGDMKSSYKGTMKDGTVMFESRNDHHGELKDGVLKVINDTNQSAIFELKKVERKSPTLGAKPPAGAVVLFDGKSADAWRGGKTVEEKYLDVGPTSKEEFQDFTLHLEFQTPFMPEARGRGAATAACICRTATRCRSSIRLGWKAKTTSAAASTRSPSRS